MIYAVAAYSITLGVLGLYGVLLKHRLRQSTADLGRLHGTAAGDPDAGFNLGAMLMTPIWLMAHGLKAMGALLLVPYLAIAPLWVRGAWIPLLFVALVPLAAGTALGFLGNRIARAHNGLEDLGEFSSSQLPYALAGIVLYGFILPWGAYFLVGAASSS